MYDSMNSVSFFGGYAAETRGPARSAVRHRQRRFITSRLNRRAWLESDRVAQAPLLQLLTGEELEAARSRFTQVDIPAGRELMHEGAPGKDFALLLDGHVEIQRHGEAINELDGGTYFGEGALLPELTHSDGFRTASVITLSATKIAVCTARDLRELTRRCVDIRTELEWTAAHRN